METTQQIEEHKIDIITQQLLNIFKYKNKKITLFCAEDLTFIFVRQEILQVLQLGHEGELVQRIQQEYSASKSQISFIVQNYQDKLQFRTPTSEDLKHLRSNTCLLKEHGVYKLIIRSDKPEAAKFSDFIIDMTIKTRLQLLQEKSLLETMIQEVRQQRDEAKQNHKETMKQLKKANTKLDKISDQNKELLKLYDNQSIKFGEILTQNTQYLQNYQLQPIQTQQSIARRVAIFLYLFDIHTKMFILELIESDKEKIKVNIKKRIDTRCDQYPSKSPYNYDQIKFKETMKYFDYIDEKYNPVSNKQQNIKNRKDPKCQIYVFEMSDPVVFLKKYEYLCGGVRERIVTDKYRGTLKSIVINQVERDIKTENEILKVQIPINYTIYQLKLTDEDGTKNVYVITNYTLLDYIKRDFPGFKLEIIQEKPYKTSKDLYYMQEQIQQYVYEEIKDYEDCQDDKGQKKIDQTIKDIVDLDQTHQYLVINQYVINDIDLNPENII